MQAIRTLLTFALAALPLAAAPAQTTAPAPSEAPRSAAARPFLYELQGHGASAWLLGTVHLPDERVLKLPAPVEAAFEGADAVFTEIETTPAAELEFARASTRPAGESLEDAIGADLALRVRARVEAAGLPAFVGAQLERLKPWVLTTTLPLLGEYMKLMTKPPLDKALYERARKAGKTVGGIETVREQIGVFEGLSAEEQRLLLRDTLDQLDEYEAAGRDQLEEVVTAWLSGETRRLLDLLEEGFGKSPELSRKVEDALIWKRNVRMTERIHERIGADPSRVCFIAIGALHLPDGRLPEDATDEERAARRGVLSLLREAGYEVRRVTALTPAPAGADGGAPR